MKQRYASSVLLILSCGAFGQTKVDLGNQSRNVDFSQASFVRPFPVGAALPATCQVGQMFFLTAAPAGANECVSTNIWAPIAGTTISSTATIDVKRTSSTLLTIGSSCSISTPCIFRIGSSVFSLLAPATVTLNNGSGLALIYIDSNANLTVGITAAGSPDITCSGCVVVSPVTAYPLSTIPLENWNATSAAWDGSGTDYAAVLSVATPIVAGVNVTIVESSGALSISSSGDGSGGGSSGGTGGGTGGSTGSAFNPMDPTQFYHDHLNLTSGFSTADGWTYSGGCGIGTGVGATGFSQESIVPAIWGQAAGAGTSCTFFFPAGGASLYGSGTYDYWSGATPAQLWVAATYVTTDTNGTHYVGLGSSDPTLPNFIGCRQAGAGDWFAVIRSGGVDVATADTGIPHDNLVHRLVVDNESGTSNTIRCTVDGGTPTVASGTVPPEPFGWTFFYGAISTGSTAANFAPFQYTIFLQGLPRQ